MSDIIDRQFKLLSQGHFGTLRGSCNHLAVELQPAEVQKSNFCKNTKWLPEVLFGLEICWLNQNLPKARDLAFFFMSISMKRKSEENLNSHRGNICHKAIMKLLGRISPSPYICGIDTNGITNYKH